MSERSSSQQVCRDKYVHTDLKGCDNIDLQRFSSFQTHCCRNNFSPESLDTWQLKKQHCSHSDSEETQQQVKNRTCDDSYGFSQPHQVLSRIYALKDETTQLSLSKLSPEKYVAIQYWINTGEYGRHVHITEPIVDPTPSCFIKTIKKVSTSQNIQGYTVLTDFLPNFKHSYVIKIHISGTTQLCILDTGAHKSMMSFPKYTQIFPKETLKNLIPLNSADEKFFGVDGKELRIYGILNTTMAIGPLKCPAKFVVYEAPHSEILIAHDIINSYQLLISHSHLYIPNSKLTITPQNVVHRISLKGNIYLPLVATDNISISAGASQFIQVQVAHNSNISNIQDEPIVCHDEDIKGSSDIRILNVWYQLCEFDKEGKTQIFYVNRSPDLVFILPGEIVCHAEKMFSISEKAITHYGSEFDRHIYHVLKFPGDDSEKPMSLDNFFIDSDTKKIDFSKPPCQGNDLELNEYIKNLCIKYKDIFSTSKFDIGDTDSQDAVSFSLISDASPVQEKPYPVNLKLHQKALKFLSTLLNLGIFRHADQNCQFASPAFFLLKSPVLDQMENYEQDSIKDNKMEKDLPVRLIVNFAKLNRKIKRSFSVFPQCSVRETLNKMRGARYVSKLDVSNCFYHLKVKKGKSQNILSFVYADLHLTPTRVMHGCVFASSVWATYFSKIIREAKLEKYLAILVDDVLVHCNSRQEYMWVMDQLFATLQKAKIKIKYEKNLFCVTSQFSAFGWTINLEDGGSIYADQTKLDSLKKLSRPRSTRDCRAFCGKFGFYSEALPRIHHILAPIFKLCSSKAKFIWNDSCEQAFITAMESLSKMQLLYLPNFSAAFFLSSDACRSAAVSHTVWQRHPTTHLLVPIRHASMSLQKTPAMANWSQHKSEAFSLFWGCSSNYIYFMIGPNYVLTDCRSLVWMSYWRYSNHQIYCWQLLLGQLDIYIIALKNDSAIISFQDSFTRPQQTFYDVNNYLKNLKFKDKESTELLSIDFSGLSPCRPGEIIKCIEKFLLWAKDTCPQEIQKIWKTYLEKESLPKLNDIKFVRHSLLFSKNEKSPFWRVENPWSPGLQIDSQFDNICEIMLNYFPQMNIDRLALLQTKDPLCQKIKKNIKHPYFMFSKILFKKVNKSYLLMLPKSLTEDVISTFHNYKSSWHLKKNKLFSLLRQTFVIQNFGPVVTKVIQNCEFCNLNTPIRHQQPVPLGLSFVPRKPMEFLNFDYIILDSSFKKYPALLTCVCVFSQFTIFIACNDKMTDDQVIKTLMERIVQPYGAFKGMGTDSQSSYVSQRIQIWSQLMGIAKFEGTAACSNPSERQHKLAKKLFQSLQKHSPLTECMVPFFSVFATLLVNEIPVQPHGLSPNLLVWGPRPKPTFSEKFYLSTLLKAPDISTYYTQFRLLQDIFLQIRKAWMKRNAEKKKKLKNYMSNVHVGDMCLLERPKFRTRVQAKLKPKFYSFPFIILRKYAKSVLLQPYVKVKMTEHPLKQRGRLPKKPKNILANLSRIKKIQNELPFLHISLPQKLFLKLADILSEKQETQQIRLTGVNTAPKGKGEIQKFLKSLNSKNLFLNDIQSKAMIKNAQNFVKLAKGTIPSEMLFTNEKVISFRNKPIQSHMTCSYNMESIFQGQMDSHTFDHKTDLSALKLFLQNRKQKLPPFKKYKPIKNSEMSLSNDLCSETTIQIVPGASAVQDFQDFLTASNEQSSHDSHFSSVASSPHSNSEQNSRSETNNSEKSEQTGMSEKNDTSNSDQNNLSEQENSQIYDEDGAKSHMLKKKLVPSKNHNSLEFSNNSGQFDFPGNTSDFPTAASSLQIPHKSLVTPPQPEGGQGSELASLSKQKHTSHSFLDQDTNTDISKDVNLNTNTKTNSFTKMNIQKDTNTNIKGDTNTHQSLLPPGSRQVGQDSGHPSEKVKLSVKIEKPQFLVSDSSAKKSKPDLSMPAILPDGSLLLKPNDPKNSK